MESKWRNFVLAPSFSVWKASGETLYMNLLLVCGKQVERLCTMNLLWVCGKQVERFCTWTFFWCVESKWRIFVHTPSFSIQKAWGEVLYIWRAPLHLWMWSIPPRKKSVYLKPLLLSISEVNLVFECFGISTSSVWKCASHLQKWNAWIQAHWNDTQIVETSLMFYCTTTVIWLMLGNDPKPKF